MRESSKSDVRYDFSGKEVVVTGGANGIGFAVLRAFLSAGAHAHCLDIKKTEELERLISDYPTLTFHSIDLTNAEKVSQFLKAVESRPISILFNNAAIFDMAPVLESSLEQYDKIFAVNVRALFQLMQGIASQMISAKRMGSIINMSSQAGRRGEGLVSHYCASKAAVISYTQSAALDFAKYGIRVNAIAPGVVDTPMWEEVDGLFAKYENRPKGEKKRLVGEQVPLGRMGKPSDIVGAVLFLASDMANYITGQTLNVDGGNVLS